MVVCIELIEIPRVVRDCFEGDLGVEGVFGFWGELLLHLGRLSVLLVVLLE